MRHSAERNAGSRRVRRIAGAAVVFAGCTHAALPARDVGWTPYVPPRGEVRFAEGCTAVAVADLDGDTFPDLVLPGVGLHVRFNDGFNGFGAPVELAAGRPMGADIHTCALSIADLDGDARLDVAMFEVDGGTSAPTVFFNDGRRHFTARTLPMEPTPEDSQSLAGVTLAVLHGGAQGPLLVFGRMFDSQASGDHCAFDATGVSVYCASPSAPTRLLGWRATGSDPRDYTQAADLAMSPRINSLGFGAFDVDGDGRDDLIAASDFGSQFALRNTAAGLVDVTHEWGLDVNAHGMGVAPGDLDEDGVTDLVIPTLGGVLQFTGRRTGGFVRDSGGDSLADQRREMWPWAAKIDDVDNDGHDDVVVVNSVSDVGTDTLGFLARCNFAGRAPCGNTYHVVWLNRGGGRFDELHLPVRTLGVGAGVNGSESLFLSDLDGDGRVEFVLPTLDKAAHAVVVVAGNLDGIAMGHGLTVRLGGRAATPGTRVTVSCGGRQHTRELYGAEGHSGAARTDAHLGCGDATRYDGVVIEGRGFAKTTLPGGPLDTSIAFTP